MRVTNTILNEKGQIRLNIRAYDRRNKEWIENLNLMLEWSDYEQMDIMHGTRKTAVNGVEVFEGDLVECDFTHYTDRVVRVSGEVRFINCRFVVQESQGVYYDLSYVQNTRIVGNIYDNP